MSGPLRIAMWSGPRSISTALMRSWGNRPDTYVTDEPLYAHYLARTGKNHPGAEEVLAHHEQDWRKVVAWLTGPVPECRSLFYQKHMAHHLLPKMANKAVCIPIVWITNPFTLVPIYGACFGLGRVVMSSPAGNGETAIVSGLQQQQEFSLLATPVVPTGFLLRSKDQYRM